MVAWVFASNHCALATLAAAADEHACCHQADQAPERESMTECCHALSAPLPAVAAAPSGQLHALFPAWSRYEEPVVAPQVPVAVLLSMHGPPGVIAFAEQVLNRSLLAHAPPVVVS
jgi:hypothetical protein